MSPFMEHCRPRGVQRGYTLVEIMISLLIGAMLIGAVVSVVAGTGLTGRRQDAQSQLAENGQIALNLLAGQLRMAGHWIPESPLPSLEPETPVLLGCRNGFASITADFGSLTCASGTGSDAIALRYNATGLSATAGLPRDCLGADVAGGWVDNRYYIGTTSSGVPALYCRGNGGGTAQALIHYVEDMQLRYGVAALNPLPPPGMPIIYDRPAYGGETTDYRRANQLTAACGAGAPAANSWCGVTSVRICLTMRSAEPSAEDGFSYINCDGDAVTSADRFIRSTVTTTVSLRNRTSVAN